LIYGAYYAVDAFFWLSGLLMAYIFVKELVSKNGKVRWALVYFHRFYRILPLYMFCLFLSWAFIKYCGDGPLWFGADGFNNDCKRYWWTNLLFLNNFLPDGDGSGCLGQAWYLANDMQFFIISPPILYCYHRISRVCGWFAILCGVVC
jgi:peptidoglycan/LPS O-acetylase OafA/YrhL